MNALTKIRKKPSTIDVLPSGDAPASTYENSRNLQDSRIIDAVQNASQWRRNGMILCAVTAASLAGNLYQSTTNKFVPYAYREDALGNTSQGRVLETAETVTDNELSAVARTYIFNLRTRYADGDALRHNIYDVYDHTANGSPASTRLESIIKGKDGGPMEQAKRQLVSVEKLHAYPVDVKVFGLPGGLRTFRVEWREIVLSRDGSPSPAPSDWVSVVSMRIVPPSSAEAVEKNPRGIYVVDFTILQQ